MFCVQADCQYPTDSTLYGTFIWFVTRSIQYLIWVYPVMYILWPRILQQMIKQKCKCCMKSKGKQGNNRDKSDLISQSSKFQSSVQDEFDDFDKSSWNVNEEKNDSEDSNEDIDDAVDEFEKNRQKHQNEDLPYIGMYRKLDETVEQRYQVEEPMNGILRKGLQLKRQHQSFHERLSIIQQHEEIEDMELRHSKTVESANIGNLLSKDAPVPPSPLYQNGDSPFDDNENYQPRKISVDIMNFDEKSEQDHDKDSFLSE